MKLILNISHYNGVIGQASYGSAWLIDLELIENYLSEPHLKTNDHNLMKLKYVSP